MDDKLFKQILIFVFLFQFFGLSAYSQNIEVKGKVIEAATGQTLPGVSVIIKGTSKGVVTDLDGNFTISVPDENAVLQFSFIGFVPMEVTVGKMRFMNIEMTAESVQLDEVMVIGYGTQKKESVIGAISSIDDKELTKDPTANITQSLIGKVPGVITVQSSGEPGYDDAQIFIRGRATISGNTEPLVLVDGIERSFSRIDPNDIDQISILKDASATAVYGVRGANGVIIVTTKRGQQGKPQIELTTNYGFQNPTRLPKYLNSYESVKLFEEARKNDGYANEHYSAETIEKYRQAVEGTLPENEKHLYPNVDWYDELLAERAPESQVSMNISGGTKRLRYFTSLTFFNQHGLYNDTESDWGYGGDANIRFRRYSFRVNLDFDVTKNLSAEVNMSTRYERRNAPVVTMDQIFSYMSMVPGWTFPVQWPDGSYGASPQITDNLIGWIKHGGFQVKNSTYNENSFVLKYKLDALLKGLSAKVLYSFDNLFDYDREWSVPYIATYSYNPYPNNMVLYGEDIKALEYYNSQKMTRKYYAEVGLNYSRTFGINHNVTGLLLYNQSDYTENVFIPTQYQGLVGRATYNYAQKYFTEVNFGFNGSENFAPGNRFGFFPSLSLGWMLSEEPFFKNNLSFFEKFKIRGSYGEVGNDKFGRDYYDQQNYRFLYMSGWSINGSTRFGTLNTRNTLSEGLLPNPDIIWERAKKYNIAFETTILNGLLGLDLDLFKENRSDILIGRRSVPAIFGGELPRENLGRVINQGYELVIRHKNNLNSTFSYYATFMYTHARNEIIDQDIPDEVPSYRSIEGKPIGQVFGYEVLGFFESETDIANSPKQMFANRVLPGDLKYKDMNGDNIIDGRDITAIGHSDIPENVISLDAGFTLKNFEFSFMLQGATNVTRVISGNAMYEFYYGIGKVQEHHLDRWDPTRSLEENKANADYPLLHYDKGQNNQQVNSFLIKNGNYLRIKNLEVAYNIPQIITSKYLGNTGIRIYATGSNLFTFDNVVIRDPESDRKGDTYPKLRFINFGIKATF